MISTIHNGLPDTEHPKRIIVVGAGMAGLVTASLLKAAGHHVTILEARDRVGGRVHTVRAPFTDGLYLDVGAMRIPQIHHLVLAYLGKFQLPINRFYNTTPNDLIYVNGVKTRLKTYRDHPGILNYPLAPHEQGKTAQELMKNALGPILQLLRKDLRHWDWVLRNFHHYSMDRFLKQNPFGYSLSPGAVNMIELLFDIESFAELSFPEIFKEELRIIFLHSDLPFYEVSGGNDRLPKAFLPQLKENLLLHHEVTKIEQTPDRVILHGKDTRTSQNFDMSGDIMVTTLPYTILPFVEIEPRHSFSYHKHNGIRKLHYSPSVKIGLEFRTRFWEEQGLHGGKSITDLPVRFSYYPSHGIGQTGPAVVLASYTWEDDALPWGSLSEDQRILQALENFAAIYGPRVYKEFVTGTSYSWADDPYAAGGFPVFKPGQKVELARSIVSTQGRVYFAGGHTSDFPGWIQGAIQSGIRVADEINNRPRKQNYPAFSFNR
ncbi:MAG TPA: flavin monoamine oxidase family protein [Bacillales bacterium]|nr:flavin monoamine oxidase family protein [Bacillales bacterium]